MTFDSVRNDRRLLLTFWWLGCASDAAAAPTGVWFEPDPCPADATRMMPLPGQPMLLSVHAAPAMPPHDTWLLIGDDGLWRAPYEAWAQWTPLPPPRMETDAGGSRWAVLRTDDGLALRFDGCRSALWVDANPQRVQHTVLGSPDRGTVSTAGHGGYVNMDARYGGLNGSDAVNALVDVGVFAPGGAGRSSLFIDHRTGGNTLRRLDSHWLIDDPERLLRLRLGDGVTHSADWETPVRFGGVQWGTDFTLQPDRITFPLPSLGGNAALASTAQLYVNGIRQTPPQALQPGAFRFDSVPTLTGAGDLTVTLRDALGREQTISQPFYASPRLLDTGLDERTVEAGFLRENFAGANDHYSRPMVAGLWRRGLDDRVTALGRISASTRRQQGGFEADGVLQSFGLLTVSAAASNAERGVGGIATLAFERLAERWSVALRRRIATRNYADLGRDPGTLHFSDAARLSWRLPVAGRASLLYISEQPWRGRGTRLAGLAWNATLAARVQAYASWLHPLGRDQGADSLVIGLSAAFGRTASASIQATDDGSDWGTRGSIQKAPDGPLGWSYQVSADSRDTGLREADAALTTARGTLGAGYAAIGDHGGASARLQTAFAVVDGHGYWSRPIASSFAVVDTGGVANVRVLRENQIVGRTDADGRLLLTDLMPYQRNHLAIDDRDLPISLGLSSGSAEIAPPADAGVPVRFATDRRSMRRLRLVDAQGAAIPAGAGLSVEGHAQALPVGYDGAVYLEWPADPARRPRIEVVWAGGHCRVARDPLPAAANAADTATVRCLDRPP